MNKFGISFVVLVMAITTLSFNFGSKEIEVLPQGDWSEWKMTDCYQKIQFRTRISGVSQKGKTCYDLQIKNNYQEKVTLNFGLNSPGDETMPSIRWDFEPGKFREKTFCLTTSGYHLVIGRVTLGKGKDYLKCDR